LTGRNILAGVAVLVLWNGAAGVTGRAEAGEPDGSGERPARLEPVVVTATRTEKAPFDVPGTVHVLSFEELRAERQVRTVPEALREVPGVMVQKTGHGQGSPYIRGFTGFRTLFMIDGVRLNNSVFRDGPNQYWNTVDPLSIERLEVVKGPSSVLYGSDAVGGTVNAITRAPGRAGGEALAWDRRLYGRYASAENASVGRAEVSGGADRFGVLVGANVKDFDDLDAGRDVGLQERTGYEEWDGDVKVEYALGEGMRLVAAHQRVDQDDAWRSHKTIYGISWEDTTVGNERKRILDQDRELTYVQFHAEDVAGVEWLGAVHAGVSYQRQAEERFRVRGDGRSDRQGFGVDTVGAFVQLESPSRVGQWTYGVEVYHDNVNSFSKKFNADGSLDSIEIQGPVADEASYDLVGVYVQNEIPVRENVSLILGARYNYAAADADRFEDPETGLEASLDEDWDAFAGSGRVLWRVDEEDRWHVFGGVSQGFRAPNLSDLTRLDTARTDEIETAAPGLDPEKFVSFEIGVKTRQADWSAYLSYYYTDINDMIVRTPTGDVVDGDNEVTKLNAGDGFVNGIEMGAEYRFHEQFTAFGDFAWMEGEVETFPASTPEKREESIDRLMPPTGHVGLRWDHPDRKYWVAGVLTAAGRADKLSTRDRSDTQRIPPNGTPGYATLALRSGWELREGLDVSVAVENVTNEDYRVHGSGQNEPGTNFVLSLDWSF